MKQLTKEQAIKFAKSGVWKDMTDKQIVELQLFQDKVCVPWVVFRESIEKVLGRGVYTHEFGLNVEGLQREFLGKKDPPTLNEIMDMTPNNKRVLIIS